MVKYVVSTTGTYYRPHVYFLNMNYRPGANITDSLSNPTTYHAIQWVAMYMPIKFQLNPVIGTELIGNASLQQLKNHFFNTTTIKTTCLSIDLYL